MTIRLTAGLLLLLAAGAQARALMTTGEALALVFPGATIERRSHWLSPDELRRAQELAGAPIESELWIEYTATIEGEARGSAYFDTHLVRTLPETLMVVLGPDGRVIRVEVIAFAEPGDYLPRRAWYDQFAGHHLDDELQLRRAIRPVTGATLSATSATRAVRRVLAVHAATHTAAASPTPTSRP